MSIYSKLLEIQKGVHGLGKDKSTYTYQYVTGSKVLSVIRPLMDQQGIILKQEIIDTTNTRQDYMVAVKGGGERQKSEIFTTVKMRFTWIDCETGETDVNLFEANGMNDWDKGIGSALTYAERYFLLKYFHISTDEDDSDYLTLLKQQEEAEKEKARKEAEEKAKQPQPITEPQMQKALERLGKGEKILDKILASYNLTEEQKKTFETAAKNANNSPENKK